MTLEDAWRELGLEPGADPETVRRAYLRLIKSRKPEQDAAGFQRLREAYEIARAGIAFEVLVVEGARRRAPPPADGARPSVPPASSAVEDAAPAVDPFEEFNGAWSRVAPSADRRERLEIARRAVAALPDDPRAHWLLVSALSRLDSEEALVDALRAAWRKGWPEFLEALLVRLPARAKRDEVDAAFASDRPELRLAGAAVAARWASRRAAAVVADLCRAATEGGGDAKGERVRALPLDRMLDVVLALHVEGALDPAAEAQAALRACLHDSGLELAVAKGSLGAVWMLTEEIDGLPSEFPPVLRAAFARATRAGDLGSAFGDAYALVRHNRPSVRGWADHLGESARNLQGLMRAALDYVPVPVKTPPVSGFRWGQLLLCLLGTLFVLGVGLLAATLNRKDDRPPPLHDFNGFYTGPPRARDAGGG